ncbi:MAG: hypothetical protein C0413_02660 [Clostridiales bacterium]|nr:hypothetical protein [Clostridiales bacterium]
MTYIRPDIEQMRVAMDDLKSGIKRDKDAEQLLDDYKTLQEQYSHADSMLSLIYLLYAFDVTNQGNRDEYAYLQSALSELDAEMQAVSADLFESSDKTQQIARESFGEGYVDAIMGGSFYDDTAVQDLLDREEQLTLEYDNLSATFTLFENGTYWSYSDIMNAVSLSNEAYYRLYDAYCSKLNEEAGPIYLEQAAIRAEIASRLGYSDYATYCYETYGRDYTPSDARTLHNAVKKYIVPIFISANEQNDTSDLSAAFFEEDAFFSAVSSSANAFSPLLAAPVTYMLQNRLYDVTDSSVKMDSSFTTYISDYRAPFIFSDWTGCADDVATILHELGHFTNYYHNAVVGYSAGDSLDLAEVDSQALVLLLLDDYEQFYGDFADQARTSTLIDAMYSLLSGCMEDEFQQNVYQNPAMTLTDMNALYDRLTEEYGLKQVYGYQGTEWVLISHNFQTPMYYISYAASMVPALELFEIAQTDPETAKNVYFNIIMREPYESLGDVLAQNGLSSVFSEETIARIADILDSYS